MSRTFYEILGVSETATKVEIRDAFRAIAKRCHPDVTGEDAEKTAEFREAADARDVLSNDERRAEYDAMLQKERAESVVQERCSCGRPKVTGAQECMICGINRARAEADVEVKRAEVEREKRRKRDAERRKRRQQAEAWKRAQRIWEEEQRKAEAREQAERIETERQRDAPPESRDLEREYVRHEPLRTEQPDQILGDVVGEAALKIGGRRRGRTRPVLRVSVRGVELEVDEDFLETVQETQRNVRMVYDVYQMLKKWMA